MNIPKLDAAVQQLDMAIRLFFEGEFLCSLTLAGAAEEMLGQLSRRAGLPAAIDAIAAFHRQDTDPALDDAKHLALIRQIANRPRNAAKHANDGDEATVEIDQGIALQMLMRAVPMCAPLGVVQSPLIVALRQWVDEHPEASN